MSHPQVGDDRSDAPTSAWGDGSSDETQIVRPPVGGYAKPTTEPPERSDPLSAPMPAAPVGAPTRSPGADVGGQPGGWTPSYAAQPGYPTEPAVTSVYPASTPGYAPAGYPPAYAQPTAVPPPASAVLPEQPSSRVGPGFLSALLGLVLAGGGIYLAARFGIAAASDSVRGSVAVKDSALATIGAVLVLGSVILNGWSPWATVIPGIVLTGIGGWTLYSPSGVNTVSRWTRSVFSQGQLSAWHVSGFTLILGLAMLAASVAAAIARASGKRDGQILGRRRS